MFGTKKEKKWSDHKIIIPPPPPKEVAKITEMLRQVEIWMASGETELAKKHWLLIAEECHKYSTPEFQKDRKVVGDTCRADSSRSYPADPPPGFFEIN